jgi:urease accessory protein
MLVEHRLGHIDDTAFAALERDYLDIEWFNVNKKIDRRSSRSGVDVGIRMDEETFRRGWRRGDVVYADNRTCIAVDILPCPCISVKGVSETRRLVRLGYETGNRHAPFFYGEEPDEFLLPYDEPMKLLLEKLGYAPKIRETRLLPENRISAADSHHHDHHDHQEHEHGHHH